METFKSLNRIATKKKQAVFDAFKLKILEMLHKEQELLKYCAVY